MQRIAGPVSRTAIAIAVSCAVIPPAVVAISVTPAMAQRVEVSAEFRSALEPYGRFERHRRWGEVWVPTDVSRDWRPYTVGHWVYSDDYGWYWASDDTEAQWGWITYHYGRWAWDDDLGWMWISGNEWGPAWVEWRRGSRQIGWAPLPPDEIVTEIRDEPRYWVAVESREFLAPDVARVVVRSEPTFFRESTVVNETVVVRERNFAVNPGIEPAFVAAAIGRPVRTYSVQPRVFAGTTRIPGAIEVRADEVRREDFRRTITSRSNIRESSTQVQPARNVPPPQALGANERGRLGQNPPRAATGTAAQQPGGLEQRRGTSGAAPQRPSGPEQGLRERAPQGPTGAAPERGERGQLPAQRERGTTGAAPERPSGQQPGLRERGPQGPTGAAPERGERGQLPAQRERGTTGAAPERPAGQQPGLRERGPQGPTGAAPERGRGTSGAAPERPSGPQPGMRERGPQGPTGAAPGRERGPGTSGAAPPHPSAPQQAPRSSAPERGTSGASPERSRSQPGGERREHP